MVPAGILRRLRARTKLTSPVTRRGGDRMTYTVTLQSLRAEEIGSLKISRTQQPIVSWGSAMVKRKPLESRWQASLDITLTPAVARLPASVPVERRDVLARHALVCRIHNEFQEMPGLSLTLGQASKVFGLPPDITSRILERLTEARVLRRRRDGQFALRVEEV